MFTEEQNDILESDARVTLVVASPGSGKTRVFAEAFVRKAQEWKSKTSGIAAISFTNVAERTIRERLGISIPYPHFIGTIDSFILRFILKPFSQYAGFSNAMPRIIPPSIADSLRMPDMALDNNTRIRKSIFQIHSSAGIETLPEYVTKLQFGEKRLSTDDSRLAHQKKKSIWGNSGLVTHSDSHFLASSILNHNFRSEAFVKLIVKRFPVIFVDEYQDTGHFLRRGLERLFQDENLRVLAVGDPDQCIFGFSGASTAIFSTTGSLSGAQTFPMIVTQRCPKAVSKLATALSSFGKEIESKDEATEGITTILTYQGSIEENKSKLFSYLQSNWEEQGQSVLVVRSNSLLDELLDKNNTEYPCKASAGRKLHHAVGKFLGGDPGSARVMTSDLLGKFLFTDEGIHFVSEHLLFENGIDLRNWKRTVYHTLVEACRIIENETWNEWLQRMKNYIATILSEYNSGTPVRMQTFNRDNSNGNTVRELNLSDSSIPQDHIEIKTVHGVKGDEFDNICLLIPPVNADRCPSIQWWENNGNNEERRIAFVAATRAKREFVLCISEQCLERFRQIHPQFVSLFTRIVSLE